MKTMTMQQIADVTSGHLIATHESEFLINVIETDSRKSLTDALFVALKGEHFDGHDYVEQAVQSGAAAVVVNKPQVVPVPQVIVEDTLDALAALGRYQRITYDIPTVGLTGSCGKTTTKEMIAEILSTKGNVHATRGNLNNQFGVPFTLFELSNDDNFSVIEMGAGQRGDIDFLTKIALPDVALITCIAEAHLEGMGSLEGIARTKSEILHGLGDTGIAVLPYDPRWLDGWKKKIRNRQSLLTFGLDDNADFYATNIAISSDGMVFNVHFMNQQETVHLALPGEHNVVNALAAIAVAVALGLSLSDAAIGLANAKTTAGRLTPRMGINGAQILDDTYNANPKAVLAAGKVLEPYQGKRIMIAGDMAELGDESISIHRRLGKELSQLRIDQLLTVGSHSAYLAEGFGDGALHFNNKQSLIDYIKPELSDDMVIVVKGSRSSAMETIVQELVQGYQTDDDTRESSAC